MRRHLPLLLLSLSLTAHAGPESAPDSPVAEGPIPVQVVPTEAGWQLLRGGEPYLIKGAGGSGPLEALAAAGGNSVRTWSADGAGEILDRAHALGLTVTVGLWLGHTRHGFDYSDSDMIAEQRTRVREAVLAHRDHPALLMWGIGNEMEGFEEGGDPVIWGEVEHLASLVKSLDPNHPTLTITADIGGERVPSVDALEHIDIHGINSYGGAFSLPERYRAAGGTKPFVLTEYGPVGTWEIPTNDWGAVQEPTSTEKPPFYRKAWQTSVLDAPGLSLGGYAFLWGDKMEGTPTWFGIFLPDGSPVAALDVLTELWSGEPPEQRAPVLQPLAVVDGENRGEPGDRLRLRTSVEDPDGDALTATWELRRDSLELATGGDPRAVPPLVEGAVTGDLDGATVTLPDAPGAYRVYLTVKDAHGKAATANLPILVEGEPRMLLPLTVYDDGFADGPWAPSGWMGNHEKLSVDPEHSVDPFHGKHALKLHYTGVGEWVGVAWQHPANDWGDQPGGFDLTGARFLEVWARGERGGEIVSLGVGLLGEDKPHPDSARVSKEQVALRDTWKRYRIKLKKKDLSQIKTGFFISISGGTLPVTVYLDQIRFVD